MVNNIVDLFAVIGRSVRNATPTAEAPVGTDPGPTWHIHAAS